jgi:hypothetical protein
MSRDETIILRVDAETKQRIADTAKGQGLSMSAFIIQAAEAAARKAKPMRVTRSRAVSGECPTFFRALVATAQQGGASGYDAAGYELTRHLRDLIAYDDFAEGQAKLDELTRLAQGRNWGLVFDWFRRELPRCAQLVPDRRRQRFVEGVSDRVEEEGGLVV